MDIETKRTRARNQVGIACESGIKSLEKFIAPAQRMVESLRHIAGLRLVEHLDDAYADDMRKIAAGLDWPGAVAKAQELAAWISVVEERMWRDVTGAKN